MANSDREELKEQLRAMAAGRGGGIDLDTPFHWVVENVKQPVPFFEHLPELLPPDSILYVEGIDIAPDIASFYSSHRAHNAVDVARDMILPVPDMYHVTFSPEVSARMREFASSRNVTEMFYHIKAYKDGNLLFTFHDAFDGWLRISGHLPEETVARFCKSLGVSFRREEVETKRRDPEQIQRLLRALENETWSEGESLWRRLWRKWFVR